MGANHSHEHKHAPPEFNRAFLIAIIANSLFVGCQLVFAHLANSTSLLADAVHNLGDVLSLMLAWVAQRLANRPPTARSTYGMKKTSILAAFANGILLVFTCGIIMTEAVYKFLTPTPVEALSVIFVASIGIIVNGATALLFLKGTHDLNIRAAFLHLLYDALVSVGVVVAGALLYWKGWVWVDPLVGLLIALVILKGTWALFTDSFRLIIDGVPRGIKLAHVKDLLSQQEGVKGVHDLHIWALSTKENALSVHLWMPNSSLDDEVREQITQKLREEHNIHHVTIQVEKTNHHCSDTCMPYL